MSKAKFGRKFLKCCICGEKIPTEEAMLHWLNDGYGGVSSFGYISCGKGGKDGGCLDRADSKIMAYADRAHHTRGGWLVALLRDRDPDVMRILSGYNVHPESDDTGRRRQSLVKWLMRYPRLVPLDEAKLIACRKYPR